MITQHLDGWLYPNVLDFVEQLTKFQLENNIIGNIAEIGVHHGKFFIPIALGNTTTTNIAIDLFDNQSENVSRSGLGNFSTFITNCKEFKVKNLRIISNNSLRVTPEDIKIDGNELRILSIDGGHFAKEVRNDLNLATETLAEGGVAIVDDFQHPGWDDVFITTLKFLLTNKDGFKPFLMGGNKLFISRFDYSNASFTNCLTIEDYYNTVIMTSEARQLLKVKTLLNLFPDVKLFAET